MEFCNLDQIKQIILKYNLGYQHHDSEFLANGNLLFEKPTKKGVYRDPEPDIEPEQSTSEIISCNIPGCTVTFTSISSYDSHYNSVHRYTCGTCKKHLPSPHLLDLHIEESHDSFFAVASTRKPMFSCFVEGCSVKSQDAVSRRDHCITDHKFPHNFRFDKVKRVKQKKNVMEVDEISETPSTSSSSKEKVFEVPKAFHFGHSSTKAFVKPRKPKKSILESDSMMDDLKDSLL